MADDTSDIPAPPDAQASDAKSAKGAKGAKKGASATKDAAASLSRIDSWVGRMRAYGGIAGFAIVLLLSRLGGLPWPDAILRALLGALVLSFIAWWCTLIVFRALIRSVKETRIEMMTIKRRQERERSGGLATASSDTSAETPAGE